MTASAEYLGYLQTPQWKSIAETVKQRAGYRCQLCNRSHNLQAHHRTYAHIFNEAQHLDDLTCLCGECHAKFHGKAENVTTGTGVGMARAQSVTHAGQDTVLITVNNAKRLRPIKPAYHWMIAEGIDPCTKGWRKLIIGKTVPVAWMKKSGRRWG